MDLALRGTQLEDIGIEYSEGNGDINEFDKYLDEKLEFPVTTIKQKFETYTMYSISFQVAVGDIRVASLTLWKK